MSFAIEKALAELSKQVDSVQDNYRLPLYGKVISNKMLNIYAALDAQCKAFLCSKVIRYLLINHAKIS
jgi:hypothetical protein